MKKFSKTLRDNWIFLLMVLPGALWLILFFYIPVFGNVVAFKDYHMSGEGFIHSIMNSKWVGLDNFKFLFSSKDAFIITRNTVLYNLGFIIIWFFCEFGWHLYGIRKGREYRCDIFAEHECVGFRKEIGRASCRERV